MINFDNLTVGFIGFGLMGGSIARSLKQQINNCRIMVYSRSQAPLMRAYEDGNIDVILPQIGSEFLECDFIFLCTPVEFNNYYLDLIKPYVSDNCILTDVGSVKGPIHKDVDAKGLTRVFIGGHPMAGSEKSGYDNSSATLLNGAIYVVTPTKDTSPEALARYVELIKLTGAVPLVTNCDDHDFAVAGISHLPHLIAASLVNLVRDNDDSQSNMHTMAAGGFKDITRIASSSAEVWQQICEANKNAISTLLGRYINSLTALKNNIDTDNFDSVYELFTESKKYRDTF